MQEITNYFGITRNTRQRARLIYQKKQHIVWLLVKKMSAIIV